MIMWATSLRGLLASGNDLPEPLGSHCSGGSLGLGSKHGVAPLAGEG